MCEIFKNSYFCRLPTEVLITILNEVDMLSVVNFCELYGCEYFLQDRNVIQNMDLERPYLLKDIEQISKHLSFEYVKSLNINCVYWISATKLRKFIVKLVNLETLYAIQTQLSLSSDDTNIFSKSKIKKLGVSVYAQGLLGLNKIYSVENLYINVFNVKQLISPIMLETLFPNLRKLWIDVDEVAMNALILHALNVEHKTKIFCTVNDAIPCIDYQHALTRYYNNRRAGQSYVMCCEKITSGQVTSNLILKDGWQVLYDLHCCVAYGPQDARNLLFHENMDSIMFEELNFNHNGPVCNERYREAVRSILSSKNTQCLQKLCISSCFFECRPEMEAVNVGNSNSFSRKRKGIENYQSSHPVKPIFENLPKLKELEVFYCDKVRPHTTIQGFPLISLFEQLVSLNIDIPIALDGHFLHEVLSKCKKLKVLKIRSSIQNEQLNYNIYNAISKIKLIDFRFENHRIQIDRLFNSLQNSTLERIALVCRQLDKFDVEPLKKFLETNPQLVFLHIVINDFRKSLHMVQQILNQYSKKHPAKCFSIDKINLPTRKIPDVHFKEMAKNENSVVATLRPFEHFLSF